MLPLSRIFHSFIEYLFIETFFLLHLTVVFFCFHEDFVLIHSVCIYWKQGPEFMLYGNTLDQFCVIRHHFLVSRFLIIFFWIACGRDGSAKLWDCGTSKCLVNLYAGSSVINSCSMQDYTSNSFTRVSARSK